MQVHLHANLNTEGPVPVVVGVGFFTQEVTNMTYVGTGHCWVNLLSSTKDVELTYEEHKSQLLNIIDSWPAFKWVKHYLNDQVKLLPSPKYRGD